MQIAQALQVDNTCHPPCIHIYCCSQQAHEPWAKTAHCVCKHAPPFSTCMAYILDYCMHELCSSLQALAEQCILRLKPPRWGEHTGSMGSKASCLAFLAGLAEGAFMLPSALPSLAAADGLRATAGANSTAVTAPTSKTPERQSALMSLA